MKTLHAGETCSFLAMDPRGCRASRACQSCLEISGCMVDIMGKCVSRRDVAYEPSKDHHNAIDAKLVVTDAKMAQQSRMRSSQLWQFPAGMVQYCRANDAACSVCTRANFWRSNTSYPDSRFCLGDDGACVCVDVCERRWYVQSECVGGGGSTAQQYFISPDGISDNLFRGLVCMVFLTAIVAVLWVRRRCAAERAFRRHQAEVRRTRSHARSRELGVNVLSLSGWETYRRDLIDKEMAQLASAQEESKTSESEGTLSSDEHDSGIHPPRAADGASSAAAYVRLDESAPSDGRTQETPSSTATVSVNLYSYNAATITRQTLAPLASERRESTN